MFGRRKQEDEDPFAALKQSGTYKSTPSGALPGIPGTIEEPKRAPPRPTARAVPSTARAAPRAGTSKRRSGRPRDGRHVFLLRVLAPLVAVAFVGIAFSAGHTGSSPGIGAINNAPGFAPVAGDSSTAITRPPRPTSYLTAAGLASGLARVQKLAPGSKPLNLRIDSTSLDAQVIQHGGATKEISLTSSGTYVIPLSNLDEPSFPFSELRPAVVPRLITELRRRFHVPPSRIDYAVADSFPGTGPMWRVFLKNGAGYTASISGSGLAPIP